MTWSRLHGLVALELLGTYEQMGIDPAPLYAHEVETLLAAAGGARAAAGAAPQRTTPTQHGCEWGCSCCVDVL